jgi:hypothetical protein
MTTEYNDSVSRNQSDGSYQAINLIRRNLPLKEIAGLTEISGIIVADTGYFACTILQIDTTENNEQPDISTKNINEIQMNKNSHLSLLHVLAFGLQGWNNYL